MDALPTIVPTPTAGVKSGVLLGYTDGPRGESRPVVDYSNDPLVPAPITGAAA